MQARYYDPVDSKLDTHLKHPLELKKWYFMMGVLLIQSIRYPSGRLVVFHPNALGQARYVGGLANYIFYHPNGSVKSFRHYNGCYNSNVLNASGLLKSQRSVCNSGEAVNNEYHYDANGNLTFWDDKQSNEFDLKLSYDPLDRLDNIRNSNNSLIGDLNYDQMGNIKKFDSISGTIYYQYDANRRLLSTSGMKNYKFEYDATGNVIANGKTNFSYNIANEMVNANSLAYTYDGHGKRVKTKSSNGTNYYMYSLEGSIIHQQINGINRENYYLGSQLIAHQSSGSITYIHSDLLGSTAASSDKNGSINERIRYAPFGLQWGEIV